MCEGYNIEFPGWWLGYPTYRSPNQLASSENRFGNAFHGLLFLLQLRCTLPRQQFLLLFPVYVLPVHLAFPSCIYIQGTLFSFADVVARIQHHTTTKVLFHEETERKLSSLFDFPSLLRPECTSVWRSISMMISQSRNVSMQYVESSLYYSLSLSFVLHEEKSSTPDLSPFPYVYKRSSNNNNNNTIDPVLVAFLTSCPSSRFLLQLRAAPIQFKTPPLQAGTTIISIPIALITWSSFEMESNSTYSY